VTGKRRPKAATTFEKLASGLGTPAAARRARGLAAAGSPAASASPVGVGLSYPGTGADAARNVSLLWRADLTDATALQRGQADPRVWNDASLRWLVDPVSQIAQSTAGRPRPRIDV
jgi:hypothetical protein